MGKTASCLRVSYSDSAANGTEHLLQLLPTLRLKQVKHCGKILSWIQNTFVHSTAGSSCGVIPFSYSLPAHTKRNSISFK